MPPEVRSVRAIVAFHPRRSSRPFPHHDLNANQIKFMLKSYGIDQAVLYSHSEQSKYQGDNFFALSLHADIDVTL